MIKASAIKNFRYSLLKIFDKAGLLRHFNFIVRKKIGMIRFKIPVVNGVGYQNLLDIEHWATEIYRKITTLYPGSFIDVGVNNGQTLLKIASINPSQSYLGFEPNPACYYYSRNLVRINNLATFNLYPVGLHSEKKMVELYHDKEFASGASILRNFRVNTERYNQIQNVAVMNGDEILLPKQFKTISFIKVDVEGAELEVISGLKETIKRYKPVLLIEILPVYNLAKENGRFRKERQKELLSIMFSLEYRMMLINESEVTLIPLNDIEVHGDMNKTNYLFIPEDKVDEVVCLFNLIK